MTVVNGSRKSRFDPERVLIDIYLMFYRRGCELESGGVEQALKNEVAVDEPSRMTTNEMIGMAADRSEG